MTSKAETSEGTPSLVFFRSAEEETPDLLSFV